MKKDNIEDIYSGLEGFSKVPPKELWDNIEARLHTKKKKRRGVLFLWGSAAAVFLLLVGYMINSSPEPHNKPIKEITDMEHRTDDNIINESPSETIKISDKTSINKVKNNSLPREPNNVASQKRLLDSNESLNNRENRNPVVGSFYKTTKDGKEDHPRDNKGYAQNIENGENGKTIKNNSMGTGQKKSERIVDYQKEKRMASNDSISQLKDVSPIDLAKALMAQNESVSDSINTDPMESSKWSVEVLGGLSNTISKSSLQGTSVNTTAQNDFVYALKLGYALSDRLVVKAGIGKNVLGQEIDNVQYTAADVSLFADNSASIVDNETLVFLFPGEVVNDATSGEAIVVSEGMLQQQFDYIQVPLEFSYSVLRKQKYNLSLGIGGNVNFLTNNRTFLNDEQIGESLGVDATIFGATVNSNVSYNIAKKTILFIEPSYNYFERPIDNNNQTFNNTQFRVLFGLRYKL